MPEKKYDALIFDLGGVLYDIDLSKTADALAALGIPDFEQYYTLQHQTNLIDKFERGTINEEEFTTGINNLTGKNLSVAQVRDAWNALLLGMPAESVDLLKLLRGMGYKLYLLSNTNIFHFTAIEEEMQKNFGINSLTDLFDQSFISYRMGMRKPDAEIYHAVRQAISEDVARAVFIDDNADNVAQAIAAGIPAVQKTPQLDILEWVTARD